MDTLNIDTKSQLAKLIATENITVQQNNVKTASFDVVNRILTLPIFKTDSKDVTDMLVAHECAHALFTPTDGWKKVSDDDELRSYVNVLEDCRIDKKIQKKYPGVVNNYLNGFEILNRQNFFGLKDKDYDLDLMLIDKINIFYKSSKKLQFNFSTLDKVWLKKVDAMKTFKDVVNLAKLLLEWQKKEVKKLKKLPDFDDHILVENYDLNDSQKDSLDSKDIDDKDKDGENSNEEGKDKQESKEGKEESESDQDKPAVSDKSAKDEDGSAGGAVGSGGDGKLTSITNNWFEGHKEKLLDQSKSYYYRSIPEPILNKVIHSNENFIKDMKLSFRKDAITARNYLPYLNKEYKKFTNDSKKTIMYLVKEFEMKKAATAYKRSSTHKTGTIDPLKLHSYKFNEDIFKRLTVSPDAKNHGMMMLLDWSGSMSDTIFKTVQQTIQLVYFCQKTNIPFELYFFSSEMDRYDGVDYTRSNKMSKGFKYKPGDMGIDKIKLVNVASHKLKKQKLDESLMYLYHLALHYETRYTWRSNFNALDRPPESVSIPSEYYLGSTPLNEALIIMLKLVPLFKTKYGIEKMNLITLTDGGGNYGCSDTMKIDPKSNKITGEYPNNRGNTDVFIYKKKNHEVKDELYGYRSTGFTGTILNMLRKYHGITTIGFYLIKRIRRFETEHYFRPQDMSVSWDKREGVFQKNRTQFNKEKVCAVAQSGYDDYYIVNAKDMKVENTDLSTVSSDMKTGRIKQLFSKSMKGRITSRVLLNKFIEKVA
tara:strand:+ start:1984 stop:4272 length:2289 start_codon:yes stop_codon:yes gene_type:complete